MASRAQDRPAVLAIFLAMTLAGCSSPLTADIQSSQAKAHSATVVAIIDTGLNPYYSTFGLPPDTSVPEVGAITLTTSNAGSYSQRLAADSTLWNSTQPDVLYHVNNSRLFGISMTDGRLIDTWPHGSLTTAIVAEGAPSVFVVLVQVNGKTCPTTQRCIVDSSVAKAMRWASEQDWIDIIAVSLGIPANPPTNSALLPEEKAFVSASRHAADMGKLVINSASNDPSVNIPSYFCGTPWTICVGGGEPAPHGQALTSGTFVDVAGNYTNWIPAPYTTDGRDWFSGTSFAAPRVAAALADALTRVRDGTGSDGGSDRARLGTSLRHALNASAHTWNTTDWNPSRPVSNDTVLNVLSPTIPIIARAPQQGWGYIDGSEGEAIARILLGAEAPSKPVDVTQAMATYQATREAYWGRAFVT